MESFSGEDKLRLLLLAALSCNTAASSSASGSSTSSGSGGASNGGGGGGGGISITFNLSGADLDRYGEQLKAAHPDLDISAIKYVHQFR